MQHRTWSDIEQYLGKNTLVVLPLGAALKEHGFHLPLANDQTMATELARRLPDADDMVITPPISFSTTWPYMAHVVSMC